MFEKLANPKVVVDRSNINWLDAGNQSRAYAFRANGTDRKVSVELGAVLAYIVFDRAIFIKVAVNQPRQV